MKPRTLILAAATLDWTIGDPESLPHPVRLLGSAIAYGEQHLNVPSQTDRQNLASGAVFAAAIAAAAYVVTKTVLNLASRLPPALGSAGTIYLASTCLASRNLDDEGHSVLRALEADDLPQARRRLSRIVGRDTVTLDAHGIARALIETLAESACDGIVAPLFFLALGGVPLAMAFKAVSTMDSMIGHRDQRYLFFGRTAARFDDVANLIPARLTAVTLLALAPRRLHHTQSLWRRDARKHLSPNAGHPEAAIAAVLNVQLGGPSTYQGEPHIAPLLNAGAPLPTAAHARRALRLIRAVSLLATLAAAAFALQTPRRPRS